MLNDEFRQRYQDKYLGLYTAFVVDVDDPAKRGRVRLHCPIVHGADPNNGFGATSGWADYFGGGGPESGTFSVPPKGSSVWVQFIDGDKEQPVWVRGPFASFNGGAAEHAKTEMSEADNYNRDTPELPQSQFNGTYPNVVSIKSNSGHRLEMDDTEGNERVLLEHKTGSRLQILEDGTSQLVSSGNKVEVTKGASTTNVAGNEAKIVQGKTTEDYQRGRTVTDNGALEYINIGGAVYSYPTLQENSNSKELIIQASYVEDIGGNRATSVVGDLADSVIGNRNQMTLGLVQHLIASAELDALPGTLAYSLKNVNLTLGDLLFASGPDPTNIVNNYLRINHPVGKLSPYDMVKHTVGLSFNKSSAELFGPTLLTPLTSIGAAGVALNPLQLPVTKHTGMLTGLTAAFLAIETAIGVLAVATGNPTPIPPGTSIEAYTAGAGGLDISTNLFTI